MRSARELRSAGEWKSAHCERGESQNLPVLSVSVSRRPHAALSSRPSVRGEGRRDGRNPVVEPQLRQRRRRIDEPREAIAAAKR